MKKMTDKRKYDARKKAELLQQFGQDNDKILAHINPQEAAFLQEMFGADINPYTGLPQFGLFQSIGDFFTKGIPDFFTKTIPNFFTGKQEQMPQETSFSGDNIASAPSQLGFNNYLNYQPTYANKVMQNNTIGRPDLDTYNLPQKRNNVGTNYQENVPFQIYKGNLNDEQ